MTNTKEVEANEEAEKTQKKWQEAQRQAAQALKKIEQKMSKHYDVRRRKELT